MPGPPWVGAITELQKSESPEREPVPGRGGAVLPGGGALLSPGNIACPALTCPLPSRGPHTKAQMKFLKATTAVWLFLVSDVSIYQALQC